MRYGAVPWSIAVAVWLLESSLEKKSKGKSEFGGGDGPYIGWKVVCARTSEIFDAGGSWKLLEDGVCYYQR